MAQASAGRRWRGSAAASTTAGDVAAPLRGAAGAVAGAVGARSACRWVYGGRVDGEAGRGRDRADVWCALFTRSCQSDLARFTRSCQSDLARVWLEPPAAHHAGDAARGGQDSGVGQRALARAQKRAAEQGATIVWVDESGFYLLPLAVRTWAPRGATPILRVPLRRDHLSVISAITLDGRLFLQVRTDSYKGEAVVGFLRVLLRKISGKLLVIWDGSPIHHGQAVKDFLAAGAAKRLHLARLHLARLHLARLHLARLPGYAPDLNPDEGIWNYLKRVELGNVCATDLAELRHRLRRAAVRVRHKPDIIRSSAPAHDSTGTYFSS
jgi:transposase